MKPIQLDAQQHHELQRRCHKTRDKRLYERLSAVLWVADGKTGCEVADLPGRSVRRLSEWLRLFRNRGLDALFTLHQKGDPRNLFPGQVERLMPETSTGRFRTSDQVRLWSDYRKELDTRMTERLHIVAEDAIPAEYHEAVPEQRRHPTGRQAGGGG
jgi:transposase